ncbi:MAG: class I SAM-dependent methyltransferase [Terriglobia bacterium]
MRVGVVSEGLRDSLVLRSRRFPRPLFDVMGAMMLSRALMAGVHFGLFDRLAASPRSAQQLARETGCDQHGMELLLDALVCCDYLEEENGRYRNTRLADRWLRDDSPHTLANFVRFNYDQWEWVSQVEQFIQEGAAQDIHQKLAAPQWRRYLLGLRDIAALSADEIVSKVPFTVSPQSLLDIGAGHCFYAIALCQRYPGLRVTVVDLEQAARIGRDHVKQAGFEARFEFRLGAVTETPLGEDHDAAFLFNVMHHLDEESNRATLRRLYGALAPGGQVVVSEVFREEGQKRPQDQLGGLLALFFGITSKREAYSFGQIAGWARAAGFGRIRRRALRTAPHASLLLAAKEARA